MVEDRIRRKLGGFERLDRQALQKYAARQPTAGWRLTVPTPEGERRLDVVVPRQFPFALPRVALVGPSMFLKWAHFERDGILCLDGEGFDVERPGAVVADRIVSACRLIGECERGERNGDFADEFLSYWGQASNDEGVPVYSLLPPTGPSRLVRVWRGKRFVLVADDDAALAAWLKSRYGSADIKTQAGALLWLDRLPLPAAFPKSGTAVRRLAADAGLTDDLLCRLVMQDASGATLLVGADTPAGPALASTWVPHPTERGRSTLGDGFRNKLVPAQIALGRYFGGGPIKRASVDRADAAWIHGRGANPKFDRFRRAKVAIIGCGSVGAAVAVLLAQSGIGHFVLIDPERLAWANIGRHPLGAPYVGSHKCVGLAQKNSVRFPPRGLRRRDHAQHRERHHERARRPRRLRCCRLGERFVGGRSVPRRLARRLEIPGTGDLCLDRSACGRGARGHDHQERTAVPGRLRRLRQTPSAGDRMVPADDAAGAGLRRGLSALRGRRIVVHRRHDCRGRSSCSRPRGHGILARPLDRSVWTAEGSRRRLELALAIREGFPRRGRIRHRTAVARRLRRDRNRRRGGRMIEYPIGVSGQALVFTDPVVETFSKHRQLRFWQREAGGQLFGLFRGSKIEVVEATGPRRTDRRTRTSYVPDRRAEQREIDERFGRGLHFLGDWHTHPEKVPRPSSPDLASLDDTVRRSVHVMQAFVLVVVGQLPAPEGLHVSLFRGDGFSHVLKPDVGLQ